jgi:leucyl aminopeptidase
MEIKLTAIPFTDVEVDALVVPVFTGEEANDGILEELDEATHGILSRVLECKELSGKDGETVYAHLADGSTRVRAKRLVLKGVGAASDYTAAAASKLAASAARELARRGIKSVALLLRAGEQVEESFVAAAVEGSITGQLETNKYRTIELEDRRLESLTFVISSSNEARLRSAVELGRVVGDCVNYTRDLANEPGSVLTPTVLATRATELAQEFGLELNVLDERQMERLAMGSLLSVARGSDEPAKLIVLKYVPVDARNKDNGLLALVGKAITFDTGGISLKPGENMELMKYDMSGGATVMGAMRALAHLKPDFPVLGVIAAAENMPSGKATKPGDVVRAMTGKTIEIINTDAEGRLVLADAIAYAKTLGATEVIDLATLTGAVSIALGNVNAAVLGTDQRLIDEVIEAGREVGEKFWQLPLDKEYSKQIKSDIADIKNTGGRKAGTITAAAFLKEFTDGLSWVHLDIAGTAWSDEEAPHLAKGPTGIGVRTLVNLVRRRARL